MLDIEAARLCQILLDRPCVSPLLNLGSSTLAHRQSDHPHIERELFEPLRRAGIHVVHSDVKKGAGIDLTGDVRDPATMRELRTRGFKCVLIANLLEHVGERDEIAAACEEIVGHDGLILATVPHSYPYHADPIDTGFRPSSDELAGLFRRSTTLLAEALTGPTYAESFQRRGSSEWKELARTALWLPIAWARPRSFASRVHRWLWHDRPYRVSIVLVKVK